MSWVLPDEPVPVRLMNTIWADRTGVHDALAVPGDLAAWLAVTELATGQVAVSDDDLDLARGLRDALRTLATWATDDERAIAASEDPTADRAAATSAVNRVAAASPPVPQLRPAGERLEAWTDAAGPPVVTALSRVAADAIALLTDDPEPQLRACYAPGCVLYFVRQHPRQAWCSPVCGNRARVARHYDRHHRGADPAAHPAPGRR